MSQERPGCRVLLVGAGHAHLHLVVRARELVEAGYVVQLLAPATFSYSGMASASATGALPADAGTVDVAALAERAHVAHHVGELEQLDLPGRRARAGDGGWLDWDVLSLNIGSVASTASLEVGPDVVRIKPLETLGDLRHRLEGHPQVTLVGGGPSALELAGNLSTRGQTRVTVLEAGVTLDPQLPARARRRVLRLLRSRGVQVHTEAAVARLGRREVTLTDGRTLTHDVAVLATGLASPALVQRIGLGGPDGIPVRATLQHRDHDDVYAVGDCADFLPRPLQRIGVHGVRQGPVLLRSLLARAAGEVLPEFVPQRQALQILDLGGGVGLAVRGRWWWQGRLALRLKRWIDRRWLRTYQPL